MLLLGRAAEQQAIDDLLDDARGGSSGTLMLRGPLGIGKSTLLKYAVESATGMRPIEIAGADSEQHVPFAAMHQLVTPMRGGLDDIPDRQSVALSSTFGITNDPSPDRLLAGLAILSLLSNAAAERPLLCIVDEAQCVDQESAEILAFVSRRLREDPVALLVAAEPSDIEGPLDELPQLEVHPLSPRATRELLAHSVAGRLDEEVSDRVVVESAGNPLAVLEFASELTPTQLTGASALPDPLPLQLHGRLEQRLLSEIRCLPEDTRAVLRLVAAEADISADLFFRALIELGIGATAIVPAESRGLVTVGARVRFPHPFIRSAVYGAASADERREVHLALAAAIDADLDPASKAWHRAAASLGTDEDVAVDLERAAVHARARSGYAAAATLLERAAQLTCDPRRRVERSLDAAEAELASGAAEKAARTLAELAPECSDDLQHARARRLEAALALARGTNLSEAPETLLRSARALEHLDVRLARDTHLEALVAALYAGPLGATGGVVEAAQSAKTAPRLPRSEVIAADLLLDGFAALFTDGHCAAAPILREAIDMLRGEEDGRWLVFGCHAATELWDERAAHALAHRWVELSRESGALTALPRALSYYGAICEVLAGRFDSADRYIDEAGEIFAATGSHGKVDRTTFGRLVVAAWRGRESEARALAEETLRGAVARGQGAELSAVQYALSVLELGLGDSDAALVAAKQATEDNIVFVATTALPELVEAAVRGGEPELAKEAVRRLAERTLPSSTDWGLGMLARSRALVAGNGDAEEWYREAISRLKRCGAIPHLARARLVYGEWLRRHRRRSDSRELLRRAYEMFVSMGADAFAERARVELEAAGARTGAHADQLEDLLTPHELRIALLVSEGLSNPEIGARLFISPRTVEYHLGKIFRKVGINSRTELARHIVERVLRDAPLIRPAAVSITG